ncbi:glycosyltransferase [Allohahella marinimesophila]|uniref:Glycosyltransferase n=1 Tax=Allohahella marinimesophila TaxID=1054972 RepID=A0ABP7Q878_9GAMM
MNILHAIETSGPGGAENFMLRLVQSQKAEGHQCRVLVIKPGWLTKQLERLGIDYDLIPLPRSLSPQWMLQVRQLLRLHNIQVVHSNEFAMNMHLALVAKSLGIPHIATVHGKNYYTEKTVRRFFMRLTARLSTLVAVSHDIKSFLATDAGIPESRVVVIENGIEVLSYTPDPAVRERYRSELGVADDECMILAVGNLYPVKGHTHLIDAAVRLSRGGAKIKVFIAGRGKEEQSLQSKIDSLGLTGQCSLLGFRDDARELLWACDIFAMPSLSEGLPLSILESLAAQRPVVASAVGGIPQVLSDGETGLLVPAGDPRALAGALEKLIVDASLRQALAKHGLALLAERYDATVMARRYAELYRRQV